MKEYEPFCIIKLNCVEMYMIYQIKINLQKDLYILFENYLSNASRFNPLKCSIISFSKTQIVEYEYSIGDSILSRVNEVKDLGVIFDTKLNFEQHITYSVNKALRKLYYILRVSREFNDINVICKLYETLIKPIVMYASPVWSPIYMIHSNKLENVQHKFFRLVAFRLNIVIKFDDHDYSDISKKLNICSLKSLRDYNDVLLLYKVIYDFLNSDKLLFYINFNQQNINLRHFRPFSIEYDPSNFLDKSCLHRVTKMINHDDNLIMLLDTKIESFKKGVKQLIFKFD